MSIGFKVKSKETISWYLNIISNQMYHCVLHADFQSSKPFGTKPIMIAHLLKRERAHLQLLLLWLCKGSHQMMDVSVSLRSHRALPIKKRARNRLNDSKSFVYEIERNQHSINLLPLLSKFSKKFEMEFFEIFWYRGFRSFVFSTDTKWRW